MKGAFTKGAFTKGAFMKGAFMKGAFMKDTFMKDTFADVINEIFNAVKLHAINNATERTFDDGWPIQDHSSGHRLYTCCHVGSEKVLHFSGILHTADITCWKQREVMWYIFKIKPSFHHTTAIKSRQCLRCGQDRQAVLPQRQWLSAKLRDVTSYYEVGQ